MRPVQVQRVVSTLGSDSCVWVGSDIAPIKIRIPEYRPLGRIYYQDDFPYPGWYLQYRRAGKLRKMALSIWDIDDISEARLEAANRLRCSVDQILTSSAEADHSQVSPSCGNKRRFRIEGQPGRGQTLEKFCRDLCEVTQGR